MTDHIELIVTGLCVGLGSAIGQYLANRHVIKYMELLKIGRKGLDENKQDGIEILSKSRKRHKNKYDKHIKRTD